MRVAYSTSKSNRELLKFFIGKFQDMESNVLEFSEGDYTVVRLRKGGDGEKIFTAVVKGSTVYVEEQGSGIAEMLGAEGIYFSTSQFTEIPEKRIEDYFCKNSYL